MGCIEMFEANELFQEVKQINRNMGCIEIKTLDIQGAFPRTINRNMGCIEILDQALHPVLQF